MLIRRATRAEVKYSCLRYHYARRVPQVSEGYSVFTDDGEFCGTVCFGTGACPQIGRPYGLVQGEVLELVRVALNGKQGHGQTSCAVMMATRQLHRDRPLVRLLVSYADMDQDHAGTIYQATNWVYVGDSRVGDAMEARINGRTVHNKTIIDKYGSFNLEYLREHVDPKAEYIYAKGKHKYLYPLDRRMRKAINRLSLPYPKKAS